MNKYYLSIFDMMNYRLLNPNQREFQIYYKNSFEKIEKEHEPIHYAYRDKKNNIKIEYSPTYDNFRFYGEELFFDIGNYVYGSREEKDAGDEIYYATIYMNRRAHDNTDITITVKQPPLDENNFNPGSIKVVIDRYGHGKKILEIDQLYNGAVFTYSHEDAYPNNILIEDDKKEIPLSDCSYDYYINEIESFIRNNYVGEYNNGNRKALYVILTSLKGCIEDLLTYWKNEVIPFTIMFKEELLKDLECKKDPKDEETITKLRDELDLLKQICYCENQTGFSLRG